MVNNNSGNSILSTFSNSPSQLQLQSPSPSPSLSRRRTRLVSRLPSNKLVKIISILVIAAYICFLNDLFPTNELYHRYLAGSSSSSSSSSGSSNNNGYSSEYSSDGRMKQSKHIFRITVTGVPNRVPTVIDSMFFEGALYDSLKNTSALSSKGIRLNTVRVRTDKTIHYQRTLNEEFTVAAGADASFELLPSSSLEADLALQVDNGNDNDNDNSESDTNTHIAMDLVDDAVDLHLHLQMDQETLARINEANGRVLAMGSADASRSANTNSNTNTNTNSIYQLSLLVSIVGTYSASSDLDYTSTVWSAINQNQMDIVAALTNPPPGTHGAEYFAQVQFLVCVGVGFRDAHDPLLEMAKSGSHSGSGSGSGSSTDTSTRGSSLSSQGTKESSNTHSNSIAINQGSQSQAVTSIDDAQLNLERTNTNDSYSTDPTTSTSDSDQDSASSSSSFEQDDDKNNTTVAFNPEASRFQLISGIMFTVLCFITVLWNFVRVAAKKAEERKKRLTIAKEAYEGSSHDVTKGGVSKTFFNRNSKYTGTMDTGAGLQ